MLTDHILSICERPLVHFGREVCGDLASGLRREWLVTNGLGGYASGTLAGPNTRRYHGLLVAALDPPVERTVLVGGMIEWAEYVGQRYALSAHEYGDGYIDQHGERNLQSFALDGALPVWTFALADALLEKRIWMEYGTNTTYVRYQVLRGSAPVRLELTPLLTYRDFHALRFAQPWQPRITSGDEGVAIQAFEGALALRLLFSGAMFHAGGDWYYNFHYREERARGLDDRSDMVTVGTFTATLAPGESFTLVLTAEQGTEHDGEAALAAAHARQRELLREADATDAPPAVQQLVLAADQFIVARTGDSDEQKDTSAAPASAGKTVIAGYHWFNDWGRDTMIALPGLTLATGRPDDAATILRTFARYLADGLLPNNFPDSAGVVPGYNTVDATLWYVHAIRAYERATSDRTLVDTLLPAVRDIAEQHIAGTRYGIGVDPADGLLRAGEPGVQLTWMDAKIGDWVVTPRTGKPVEINALWYNLLRTLASWLRERGDAQAQRYDTMADQARDSFRARFAHPDRDHLADVVDGPDGDDWTLRPNQIFAVSLPHPLLDGTAAERVVSAIGRALFTSYGLRSLGPNQPAYRGDYGGDAYRRDSGYHQGPAWTWLLGAFVEAHYRVYDDRDAALTLLRPIEDHLRDAGLGSVSELLEGDTPHVPRGCVAQAWGVAEVLRVWRQLL